MKHRSILAICYVVVAGLAFSFCCARLGTDLESPEIFRYLEIATVPLTIVLVFSLVSLRLSSLASIGAVALLLSAMMCIPMESAAYLITDWPLWGREALGRDHLASLVMILLVWSVVIAIVSTLGAFAVDVIRTERGARS